MTTAAIAGVPSVSERAGRSAMRWGVSLLAVAALHAGGAYLLGRIVPVSLTQPVEAPAIEIDMAPPAPEPSPEPPAPTPPAAAVPPAVAPPPVPVRPEPPPPETPPDPPQVPQAPSPMPDPPPPQVQAPEPEVVLPLPPPPPPPPPRAMPRPRPPRPVLLPRPAETRDMVTPPVTAPAMPAAAPSPAAPAVPPAAAVAAPSPQVMASWQGRLVALLQRNLRYPDTAGRSREQGVASVTFTMDRTGHVVVARIAGSSGYQDLDQEALAVLQRSQPLPPPPAEMPNSTVTLAVPIRFRAP